MGWFNSTTSERRPQGSYENYEAFQAYQAVIQRAVIKKNIDLRIPLKRGSSATFLGAKF